MLALNELLNKLHYQQSPYYYTESAKFRPETAHLFRVAQEIGVNGVYVIQTSPSSSQQEILPTQPAVYVAEVHEHEPEQAEKKARDIHKNLWNLCFAPFIIITLPHQIRVYTGFNFSSELNKEQKEEGLLEVINHESQLEKLVTYFSALAIDTGQVWSHYEDALQTDNRVDQHLLKNLNKLGQLLQENGLPLETAHALIGKYVFLHYLRQRNILSDTWLHEQGLEWKAVASRYATRSNLQNLLQALSDFNGQIFPIDFDDPKLHDNHIATVASVFCGDKPEDEDNQIWQLHLGFKAYDFQYIPVETLSAIYEQFLLAKDKTAKKEQGVVYTPEYLADYLLSEVASVKPLQKGMKILDPACGSGVFLVLAYRRLIESLGGKTTPEQLRDILQESIYGVERNKEACYIAEFSLILTLLHYSEPSQLQDLKFKLPDLHNHNIFEADFFDFEGESGEKNIWKLDIKFDWIVGNPPWVELKPQQKNEQHIRLWFNNKKHKKDYPTGGNRIAEAFSWEVTKLLEIDGVVGLLLPATTLVNSESENYRKIFFSKHDVYRITNFANLRYVLFGKEKKVLPAITMIYSLRDEEGYKSPYIEHYAPFLVNQSYTLAKYDDKPWKITINENEIQTISVIEAQKGETDTWKLALWGTVVDEKALERLRFYFPETLSSFCETMGWGQLLPREAIQLRDSNSEEGIQLIPDFTHIKKFDTDIYNRLKLRYRFSMPYQALVNNDKHYLRSRGTKLTRAVYAAPHIVISPSWQNFIIYSEEDFVIAPRQMGISVPDTDNNKFFLKALALYLSSSLVAYYLFFHVPQWGMYTTRDSVTTKKVRKVPTPTFTIEQAKLLANLHTEIVEIEQNEIEEFINSLSSVQTILLSDIDPQTQPQEIQRSNDKKQIAEFENKLQQKLQAKIDEAVYRILDIPQDIQQLVEDFIRYRLPLDKPGRPTELIKPPSPEMLFSYAKTLQQSLNDFTMGDVYHNVIIIYSEQFIECMVELVENEVQLNLDSHIQKENITMAHLLNQLSKSLREQVSQWVYVQRGLRLFDGEKVYLYKPARLIDWTYGQALTDASDIIGAALKGDK